ncbi:uncharacterized protein [Asterias amurensis]|uniref:uncharacterized protein n=1 Tax=Asterias amurensis TaxID=7602 RepID=UPI003AB792CC
MECRLMLLVCMCVVGKTCQEGREDRSANEGNTTYPSEPVSEVTCSWTPSQKVTCSDGKVTSGSITNSIVLCRNASLSEDCEVLTMEMCFCQPDENMTCTKIVLELQKSQNGKKFKLTPQEMTPSCEDSDCTQMCSEKYACQIQVPVCNENTDGDGSGFVTSPENGNPSTGALTTSKATTTTDTNGAQYRLIGIGIGIVILVLLTIAILVVLCRGQRRERSHVHGVNWDDPGYMGVEIKGRPLQRQGDVTDHVRTEDGFNNQTYEDEIAVGIRGGSNRTITPVVPPVPASPGGVPLTPEGYVDYNPKSGETSRTASSGGLKHKERPLPVPGSHEVTYEEIKDLVSTGLGSSSAQLKISSIPSGHNTPVQISVVRSRSTGYVDVDCPDPVFEATLGSDGKDPCSVAETTPNEKVTVDRSKSTGYVDVDYPDPVFATTHGSDDTCSVGKITSNEKASVDRSRSTGYVDFDSPDPVFETTPKSDGNEPCPVAETTPTEKAFVDRSRSTGYVDFDSPDPVFETTPKSDGNEPCPVAETTPTEKAFVDLRRYVDFDTPDPVFETTRSSDENEPCSVNETTPDEKCDGHVTEATPIYFILEQPPTEPEFITDSEKPAQRSRGAPGRDGPGDPFEVGTEADVMSHDRETAPSPGAGLTEPLQMGKRQTRSMTSPYSKLDRGPLWRKVTK